MRKPVTKKSIKKLIPALFETSDAVAYGHRGSGMSDAVGDAAVILCRLLEMDGAGKILKKL